MPVAPPGNPDTESVSCDPKPIDGGDADSVIDVVALVTVKLAPAGAGAGVVAVTRVGGGHRVGAGNERSSMWRNSSPAVSRRTAWTHPM
jgi:hypothetical protein